MRTAPRIPEARTVAAVSALLLLAACGTQVTVFGHTVSDGRPKEPQPATEAGQAESQAAKSGGATAAAAQVRPMVRDVLLSLNATVRQQANADRRFDDESLHATIAAELRQRGLMGAPDSTEGTPVDILIDGYSLQDTGNAAAVGRNAHAGRLSGLVRVLDADGKEMRSYKVLAESIVEIPAQAGDKPVLDALYRKFAVLTAEGLAPPKAAPKK